MLSKITSKNQITIPKKIMNKMPDVDYFDVELNDGIIMLKPIRLYDTDLDNIRAKVERLGIDKDTVAEAIIWARAK